jgi:hypothetical protein
MTTDVGTEGGTSAANDPTAARLEALRRRRAPSILARANALPGRRRRRRHAAIGARIMAAGLSASITLGLVGALARASKTDSTGGTAITPAPAVVVRRTPAPTASGAPVPTAPSVPPVTATNAPPVTSSHAS